MVRHLATIRFFLGPRLAAFRTPYRSGVATSPLLLCISCSAFLNLCPSYFAHLALAGRGALRHGGRLVTIQACATVDHFRQLVGVAGPGHGHFHGAMLLLLGLRQRMAKT